jgi:hypothetical protein
MPSRTLNLLALGRGLAFAGATGTALRAAVRVDVYNQKKA